MTTVRTKVAVTSEELSPGVPDWGINQNVTELPPGETEVAIENLVAGRTYYVKTWNEDEFGNRSPEVVRTVTTGTPTKLVPLTFSANGYLDSGSPMRAFVKVPDSIISVDSALVTLAFRQFMAPATAATATGTLTSVSGGGSTSGASSSSSSGSKHLGLVLDGGLLLSVSGTSGAASAGTAHTHVPGTFQATGNPILVQDITDHDHTIAHTHTTPNHTHDITGHSHTLTYGTFEESYPASHSVTVTVYKRSEGAWALMDTTTGLTGDLEDLDLTSVITSAGDWRIEIISEAAQPNDGRLGCDIFGTLTLSV